MTLSWTHDIFPSGKESFGPTHMHLLKGITCMTDMYFKIKPRVLRVDLQPVSFYYPLPPEHQPFYQKSLLFPLKNFQGGYEKALRLLM
jgi:hypothetical protein